jgi:hypothetical protein
MAATGASEEEARRIVDLIQAEQTPRSLSAYIAKLATEGDLTGWLERVRDDAQAREVRDWLDRADASGKCEHAVPGGAELHPLTGTPRCPLCRSAAHPAA